MYKAYRCINKSHGLVQFWLSKLFHSDLKRESIRFSFYFEHGQTVPLCNFHLLTLTSGGVSGEIYSSGQDGYFHNLKSFSYTTKLTFPGVSVFKWISKFPCLGLGLLSLATLLCYYTYLACHCFTGVLRIIGLKVYWGRNPLMHVLTVMVQPKQWHLTKDLFGEGGSAEQPAHFLSIQTGKDGKGPICAGIFAHFQK